MKTCRTGRELHARRCRYGASGKTTLAVVRFGCLITKGTEYQVLVSIYVEFSSIWVVLYDTPRTSPDQG
jgi:hypothetical protein